MRLDIRITVLLVTATVLLTPMLTEGTNAQQQEDNYWTTKTSMQQVRIDLGAATVNGKIYAIGGNSGHEILGTNEQYNPQTDTWSYRAPMPTPRYGFGIAVYENKIYCFGGKASSYYATNIVEVYDTSANTWKTLPSMPTPKMNLQTAVVGDKIYLLGGRNTDIRIGNITNYRTVEVFNPNTGDWATAPSIPQMTSAYDTFASSIGNNIYVIAQSLNMIYNTQNKIWCEGAPPPNAPPFLGCINAGTFAPLRIYIFGTNNTVDSYNPTTDSWTSNFSNASLNYYAAVATANDRFYVLGGFFFRPTDYSRDGPSVNKFQEEYSGANMQYTPTGYKIQDSNLTAESSYLPFEEIMAEIQPICPANNESYTGDIPLNVTVHFSARSKTNSSLIPYRDITCQYQLDNGSWINASVYIASEQKVWYDPIFQGFWNQIDCNYGALLEGLSNGKHSLNVTFTPDLKYSYFVLSNGSTLTYRDGNRLYNALVNSQLISLFLATMICLPLPQTVNYYQFQPHMLWLCPQ